MKSIFFLMIFSLSLFAIDISSFDIKGMTMNDSYNTILKKLPCSPKIDIKKTESGKIAGYELACNYDYTIYFNRYKKITAIYRTKYFNIRPNLKKIHRQLIKKYGEPTLKKRVYPQDSDTEFLDLMCWGNGCGIQINLISVNKGLTISYQKRRESSSNYDELSFVLQNSQLFDENSEWERKENKRYEEKQLDNTKDAVDL